MVRIKGSVLQSRLALITELAPDGGLERVLGRLDPAERQTLGALLASSWYPFELGRSLDTAIVDELGGGRPEFFEKLGEASAEKNLGPGGVHRRFLVDRDPHAFLERAPLVYSYYYDQGHREYERVSDNEAVLTTHEAETYSAPDCATVVGWYRRALEMCGVHDPRVVEERCRAKGDDVCRYRLTWSR
jgi:uncharacterized protein (TIGR02265 family)